MAPLRSRALAVAAALLAVALLLWLGQGGLRTTGSVTAPGTVPVGSPAAAGIARPDIGFRDARELADHFARHGTESGAASATDYLARAQALRDRPAGGAVLEVVRADGVVTRFDRENGDFLAFNPDLTIRTFFRPNDGERYFRRQLQREHRDG